MNTDFPRTLTLLRKEKKISQKAAAQELGVSQALLSHYEKGIRECGLDFLVKAADYYNVSCDFLLGRSPEPGGNTISFDNLPEPDERKLKNISRDGMMIAFNKRLISNSTDVLFTLMQNTRSDSLVRELSTYIMLAIYKAFRIVFSCSKENDSRFFTVPESFSAAGTDAAMSLCEAAAVSCAAGVAVGVNDKVDAPDAPVITMKTIGEEFPQSGSALLNLIKNSEAKIQLIMPDKK